MKCKNCGYENKDNTYCEKCGKSLSESLEPEIKKKISEDELNKGNSIIYIVLFALAIIFGICVTPIGYFIGLIIIVTGFLKCPKSVIIKVLFGVCLVFTCLFIMLYLFFAIACNSTTSSCDSTIESCQSCE